MNGFEIEEKSENTVVCVNKEALSRLNDVLDEVRNDFHVDERSTWFLQIVLAKEGRDPGDRTPISIMAESLVSIFDSQENWSCVRYAYSPIEMCFNVFIHNPKDKPQLRDQVRSQCIKISEISGWNLCIGLMHTENQYSDITIFLRSIEGRYKRHCIENNIQC